MNKRRFPQIRTRRMAIGLVSVVGVLGFATAFGPSLGAHPQQAPEASVPRYVQPPTLPEAKALAELSDAFAAVVDAVRPSVVYIEAAGTKMVSPQLDFWEAVLLNLQNPVWKEILDEGMVRRLITKEPDSDILWNAATIEMMAAAYR